MGRGRNMELDSEEIMLQKEIFKILTVNFSLFILATSLTQLEVSQASFPSLYDLLLNTGKKITLELFHFDFGLRFPYPKQIHGAHS